MDHDLGFTDDERAAVYRAIDQRRDVRTGFLSDPVDESTLERVLSAAHSAPSVGFTQPWDFVVIRDESTKARVKALATKERDAYAAELSGDRSDRFDRLKIEAITEAPVNIVVTCDPTRGGAYAIGRRTQPRMTQFSAATAVQNLWLAARAEGLGVGWVSYFDERELAATLDLPQRLEVIAYLCVGHVSEFLARPELEESGWAKRRPLSWTVHQERYGDRGVRAGKVSDLVAQTIERIRPLNQQAMVEALQRLDSMTKPAGSLGQLENLAVTIAGITGVCPSPPLTPSVVAVFAGDHGVLRSGISPWPQEVTQQMVANVAHGGAVINSFARQIGAEVCVVDVGVATDVPDAKGLLQRKVVRGTNDFSIEPAMTRAEAMQAIEVGIELARDLVAAGNKLLITGDLGIGNTSASSALVSVFTGTALSIGRGTGVNDAMLARKTHVITKAIALHQPDPADPIGVLAAFGGAEHGALAGFVLGAAALDVPVVLDGVIATSAALIAQALAPAAAARCVAGHQSAEPAHVAALTKLGLTPLVQLDLRLGEGTGAALAVPIIQAAARTLSEVATFDSAGVSSKKE
jgi:nicotinate-nucleotide--dimethylbenzimidazole phosphoribosyltransferase